MSAFDPLPFPNVERIAVAASRAFDLSWRLRAADVRTVLATALAEFPGRIALVSSFGAESAVLLHLVAQVAPDTPVLLLDTGKLFAETLGYRDRLAHALGLRDVRAVRPAPADLAGEDPAGTLHRADPDRCCQLRKVAPLNRALAGFDAWITGRKRFQGGQRRRLAPFEADGERVKVNPLAAWSKPDLEAYFAAHRLPRHPLEAEGYRSIGCAPCTARALAGEAARAGRWRGRAKDECGIHLPRSA